MRAWAIGCCALAAAMALASCATAPKTSPAERAQICTDHRFPVYFAEGSDQLTAPAQKLIADTAAQLRTCRLGTVDVLGLSDATGSTGADLELSRRRASAVAAALKTAGLPAPNFQTAALGKAGATTASGRRVPVRRMAEVVIHATPQ